MTRTISKQPRITRILNICTALVYPTPSQHDQNACNKAVFATNRYLGQGRASGRCSSVAVAYRNLLQILFEYARAESEC